jgi:DNA polymerase-3 subunit epsilon
VVDTETSGLNPVKDRVLSVAILQVSPSGVVDHSWSTLLNPGCDPGPVHIHGLTKAKLHGAPQFADVVETIRPLVQDRVLVGHNISFDWNFLASEAARAQTNVPVSHRLCTMQLTRRVDIPVESLSLPSVARYWRVATPHWHDAMADANVVVEILRRSLDLAHRIGAKPQLAPCAPPTLTPYPPAAPRTPCPWCYPGRWSAGSRLRQGMKVVFTGDTAVARETLIRRATDAGLDVMNSVSSRTSLLIRNSLDVGTRKAERAQAHQTPTATEAEFLTLLELVEPGESPSAKTPREKAPTRSTPRPPAAQQPNGPLLGKRVLVLGGTHAEGAGVRERVVALGGQAAANLTASVTHVVLLAGHHEHPRWNRVKELQLGRLDPDSLVVRSDDQPQEVARADIELDASEAVRDVTFLSRGAVTDLLMEVDSWVLSVTWPDVGSENEIDVVALVVDADEQVRGDEDFCFYNQPEHPTGAVSLDLDTPLEALVALRPIELPDEQQRVIIAAAVDGEARFGDVGPIELALRTGDGELVARATLDAATEERTMVLAHLYLRNGMWRFRAVGQGYPFALTTLAVSHGVDIED